jgi:branched-chain amino acid transport system ATP-binding protein
MKEKEGKILEFKDISKYFGGTVALQKVTGAIGYNQILGIIGPNGAGKTTLLNVINGFLPPQTGQIIYQNKDVTGKKPYIIARFGLGRTFQVTNLFKGMSVLENVMVGGNASVSSGMLINGLNLPRARREEASIKKKAIQDLAFLGLLDKAHERVENLPYGDQKLIELARALAMEPNLLLLDEPASGLNAAETERLSQILKRIRNEGIGIIIVEHNMPLIMSISDLVLVLDFGHRIAFGTPEEIVQDEKVIRAYLGKETYSA